MTGRDSAQQRARVYASLDAVPPIDRWNELTAQSEALEQRMTDYATTMRAEHAERERDRLEWFNRATHSDALREMQLVEPVVITKPVSLPGDRYLPVMGLVMAALCVCVWARAGA